MPNPAVVVALRRLTESTTPTLVSEDFLQPACWWFFETPRSDSIPLCPARRCRTGSNVPVSTRSTSSDPARDA